MKIQIIGMGRVGSAIAFATMLWFPEYDLHLVDTDKKKLKGEYDDLLRVNTLYRTTGGLSMSNKPKEADVSIICAGKRRDYAHETEIELLQHNLLIVDEVVSQIKGGQVIIVTNPAKEIFTALSPEYYRLEGFDYAGDECDKLTSGEDIMKNKGHTCWGIAIEVVKML